MKNKEFGTTEVSQELDKKVDNKIKSIYKTENLKNRTFKNDELIQVVKIAKEKGYNVYTFESSSKCIVQIFIEDLKNGRIGTCQAYYSGIQFSTMHKSKRGSGNGTGFGNLVKGVEFNNPKNIDVCFITYPYWLRRNSSVIKYTSFDDYINKGLGILNYYKL